MLELQDVAVWRKTWYPTPPFGFDSARDWGSGLRFNLGVHHPDLEEKGARSFPFDPVDLIHHSIGSSTLLMTPGSSDWLSAVGDDKDWANKLATAPTVAANEAACRIFNLTSLSVGSPCKSNWAHHIKMDERWFMMCMHANSHPPTEVVSIQEMLQRERVSKFHPDIWGGRPTPRLRQTEKKMGLYVYQYAKPHQTAAC